jgi:hypothetical protein
LKVRIALDWEGTLGSEAIDHSISR